MRFPGRMEGELAQGLVWESVAWRRGQDSYRFDIERGGLFATLSAPGGRSMTLPMVVWEGLLDALKASRTTRVRSEQQFPARARARWYDGELAEVADAFKSGRSVAQIASAHNRSVYAIEHQLDRLGLLSTAQMHGPRTGGVPSRAAFGGGGTSGIGDVAGECGEAVPWSGVEEDAALPDDGIARSGEEAFAMAEGGGAAAPTSRK